MSDYVVNKAIKQFAKRSRQAAICNNSLNHAIVKVNHFYITRQSENQKAISNMSMATIELNGNHICNRLVLLIKQN